MKSTRCVLDTCPNEAYDIFAYCRQHLLNMSVDPDTLSDAEWVEVIKNEAFKWDADRRCLVEYVTELLRMVDKFKSKDPDPDIEAPDLYRDGVWNDEYRSGGY